MAASALPAEVWITGSQTMTLGFCGARASGLSVGGHTVHFNHSGRLATSAAHSDEAPSVRVRTCTPSANHV